MHYHTNHWISMIVHLVLGLSPSASILLRALLETVKASKEAGIFFSISCSMLPQESAYLNTYWHPKSLMPHTYRWFTAKFCHPAACSWKDSVSPNSFDYCRSDYWPQHWASCGPSRYIWDLCTWAKNSSADHRASSANYYRLDMTRVTKVEIM